MSIALCLLLLCSVVGCSKTENNTRSAEWGYFYFPNTDWGMTEDELFTALKKEKSDFEFGELPNGTQCYLVELSPLGEKVKTRFDFTTGLISDTPRLTNVQLQYNSDFTEEKIKEIKQKLDKLFKEQNVAVESEWEKTESNADGEAPAFFYAIKSQGKMTDLPQDIKDAYNTNVADMYKSGEYKLPDLGNTETTDFIKADNSSMSTVRITHLNDDTGYISFGGNIPVQVLEYAQIK